jgi:hypothetical protein
MNDSRISSSRKRGTTFSALLLLLLFSAINYLTELAISHRWRPRLHSTTTVARAARHAV